MRRLILVLLVLVLALGGVGVIVPELPFPVPGEGATLHVIVGALLVFLAGLLWRPLVAVAAVILALSVAVEATQWPLPGRDASFADLAFNVLGIALGVGAAVLTGPLGRSRTR